MPYDEEYQKPQSSSDKNEQSYLLLFVLHVLLFESFGMALYAPPVWFLKINCNIILFVIVASIYLYASPVWFLKINCNIILFVIVASIYKQAMKEWKPTCSAVVLLPEILQIIILSVMILSSVDAACLLLVISNFCLAVLAATTIVCTVR
jgi:hypothetical protein